MVGMPDELEAPPAQIRAHAGSVRLVADGVELAREAAASVQLGREAYGQLCQFLPGMFDEVQQAAIDALAEAVGSLEETALELAAAAGGYQDTDEDSAGELDRLHPGGGGAEAV